MLPSMTLLQLVAVRKLRRPLLLRTRRKVHHQNHLLVLLVPVHPVLLQAVIVHLTPAVVTMAVAAATLEMVAATVEALVAVLHIVAVATVVVETAAVTVAAALLVVPMVEPLVTKVQPLVPSQPLVINKNRASLSISNHNVRKILGLFLFEKELLIFEKESVL